MASAWTEERARLANQLRAEALFPADILAAVERVPRHEFVPSSERRHAYENRPLPIGYDQTISQPFIVALMSQLAEVSPGDRVLEIGTGCGYQTAVLVELGAEVFTVEIVEALALRARADLERLGYGAHIRFRIGDGSLGWEGAAPFDSILVTAAPPAIPAALPAQLRVGGRLVIPVGEQEQVLRVGVRTEAGFAERSITRVSFVPMTGDVQEAVRAESARSVRTRPAPPGVPKGTP